MWAKSSKTLFSSQACSLITWLSIMMSFALCYDFIVGASSYGICHDCSWLWLQMKVNFYLNEMPITGVRMFKNSQQITFYMLTFLNFANMGYTSIPMYKSISPTNSISCIDAHFVMWGFKLFTNAPVQMYTGHSCLHYSLIAAHTEFVQQGSQK